MVFDVAAEFGRIDRALVAWVAASGQPSTVTIAVVDAPDSRSSLAGPPGATSQPGDAPRADGSRPSHSLAARRLGWRVGRRTGRFATERELIAEYFVTAQALTPAEADAVLARLAASTAEGLQDIAPVPPSSPLWQSLRLAPRPALIVAAAFKLTAGEASAPSVQAVDARIGTAVALEGRVMQGGAGVAGARVSNPGDGCRVRTDQEGRFVLANWSGQSVTVEHRRTRRSFTPVAQGPESTDWPTADHREVVLTLPAED